jgi:hypothetical protein
MAAGVELTARDITVCVDGSPKTVTFLCSLPR